MADVQYTDQIDTFFNETNREEISLFTLLSLCHPMCAQKIVGQGRFHHTEEVSKNQSFFAFNMVALLTFSQILFLSNLDLDNSIRLLLQQFGPYIAVIFFGVVVTCADMSSNEMVGTGKIFILFHTFTKT